MLSSMVKEHQAKQNVRKEIQGKHIYLIFLSVNLLINISQKAKEKKHVQQQVT